LKTFRSSAASIRVIAAERAGAFQRLEDAVVALGEAHQVARGYLAPGGCERAEKPRLSRRAGGHGFGQREKGLGRLRRLHDERRARGFPALHRAGQGGVERFAPRAAVVAGQPAGEFKHARIEQRLAVEQFDDLLDARFLDAGVRGETYAVADQYAPAEGDPHARARRDRAFQRRGDAVVKRSAHGHVQHDRRVRLFLRFAQRNLLIRLRPGDMKRFYQTRPTEAKSPALCLRSAI